MDALTFFCERWARLGRVLNTFEVGALQSAYNERRDLRYFRSTCVRDDLQRERMGLNLNSLVDEDQQGNLSSFERRLEGGERLPIITVN